MNTKSMKQRFFDVAINIMLFLIQIPIQFLLFAIELIFFIIEMIVFLLALFIIGFVITAIVHFTYTMIKTFTLT